MKRKYKLFWKTFGMAMGMLTLISILISVLIYLLIPPFYKHFKLNEFQQKFDESLVSLSEAINFEEEISLLTNMLQGTSVSFNIRNERGDILAKNKPEIIFSSSIEDIVISENSDFIEIALPNTPIFFNLEFTYINQGNVRILEIFVPIQPLTDARHVIINIFPIVGLITIFFAFGIATIFTRWFVVPIKKISDATAKMANFDPDISIPLLANDEIGDLGRDINHLYGQLQTTITVLEAEIRKFSTSENKKINFLQTISHEMKNPLASANALIEGIIYEIPPYDQETKKYLNECHAFLEKAITLIKESLNLSDTDYMKDSTEKLSTLINRVSKTYQVIFCSKNIQYDSNIPADLQLTTKINLLEKVLSNLYSNAANYTPRNGNVTVHYEDGILSIENNCNPLTHEEVKKYFEAFNSSGKHQHSNGLGLYIIKQLLTQMRLPFSFESMPKNDGMIFRIDLTLLLTKED